jgi:hypothetical protein
MRSVAAPMLSLAATGHPQHDASFMTTAKGSYSEGNTIKSAVVYAASNPINLRSPENERDRQFPTREPLGTAFVAVVPRRRNPQRHGKFQLRRMPPGGRLPLSRLRLARERNAGSICLDFPIGAYSSIINLCRLQATVGDLQIDLGGIMPSAEEEGACTERDATNDESPVSGFKHGSPGKIERLAHILSGIKAANRKPLEILGTAAAAVPAKSQRSKPESSHWIRRVCKTNRVALPLNTRM